MANGVTAGIDWLECMELHCLNEADTLHRFPNEWVKYMCRRAVTIAITGSTNCEPRLDSGDLDVEDFEYVVCSMVWRVIRYSDIKTESNGTYQFTRFDPQDNQPGKDASPNLYLSKREKQILDGYASGRGPIGTVGVGVNRIYGM
ncbi:MAG: hypothetical protein E7H36_00055 [Bifidobacterium dentium]|jgi:hypothetical protein|nr:hypothetical protein [Bifidobacterium dentium]